MLKRKATAVWRGNGMEGQGALTSTSGALASIPYSFKTRFKNEDGKAGTNPEELIAAAHAGCFSMALSFQIAGAGHTAEQLKTEAEITMEQQGAGFAITKITLMLEGMVPGIDRAKFEELAKVAKENCPVSKALSATPIELQIRKFN